MASDNAMNQCSCFSRRQSSWCGGSSWNSMGWWMAFVMTTASWRSCVHQQEQLQFVAYYTSKAIFFQAKASTEQQMSNELSTKSKQDQLEATTMQEESKVLETDANDKLMTSNELHVQANEMEELVTTHESEALEHFAQAVIDHGMSQDAVVASLEETEQALVHAARAHETEVGMGVCQAIPGLDVVCDALGGMVAIGLEMTSTTEATQAAIEGAASMNAHEAETSQLAQGEELQLRVQSEQAVVAQEEARAAALLEQSEAERVEAAQDQALAEDKLEESSVKQEEAVTVKAQSARDEVMANASLEQVVQHGILAIGWTVAEIVTGVVALVGVIVRVLWQASCVCLQDCFAPLSAQPKPWIQQMFVLRCGWYLSLIIHSIVLTWLATLVLSNHLTIPTEDTSDELSYENDDTRTRSILRMDHRHRRLLLGAAVLQLAFVATALQVVLLQGPRWYCIQRQLRRCLNGNRGMVCRWMGRIVIDLAVMMAWNVYLVIVLLQRWKSTKSTTNTEWDHDKWHSDRIPTWVVLGVAGLVGTFTLVSHHWMHYTSWSEMSQTSHIHQTSHGNDNEENADDDDVTIKNDPEAALNNETTALLGHTNRPMTNLDHLDGKRVRFKRGNDLRNNNLLEVWTRHHQLVLGGLFLAILLSLLKDGLSHSTMLRPFWLPAQHAIVSLLTKWWYGHWWILLWSVIGSVLTLLFLVLLLRRRFSYVARTSDRMQG